MVGTSQHFEKVVASCDKVRLLASEERGRGGASGEMDVEDEKRERQKLATIRPLGDKVCVCLVSRQFFAFGGLLFTNLFLTANATKVHLQGGQVLGGVCVLVLVCTCVCMW